eukprot:TRINITY_DN39930_c0_g1_i1.p1 TRINITY_DN39930_c0_g1~~TRINITY_DN39930_c0_g1_i1.p1  ORF type:complete len:470 (-),score=82.32 TRINITY_DN39930_c0_g1_i1:29-1249(-)
MRASSSIYSVFGNLPGSPASSAAATPACKSDIDESNGDRERASERAAAKPSGHSGEERSNGPSPSRASMAKAQAAAASKSQRAAPDCQGNSARLDSAAEEHAAAEALEERKPAAAAGIRPAGVRLASEANGGRRRRIRSSGSRSESDLWKAWKSNASDASSVVESVIELKQDAVEDAQCTVDAEAAGVSSAASSKSSTAATLERGRRRQFWADPARTETGAWAVWTGSEGDNRFFRKEAATVAAAPGVEAAGLATSSMTSRILVEELSPQSGIKIEGRRRHHSGDIARSESYLWRSLKSSEGHDTGAHTSEPSSTNQAPAGARPLAAEPRKRLFSNKSDGSLCGPAQVATLESGEAVSPRSAARSALRAAVISAVSKDVGCGPLAVPFLRGTPSCFDPPARPLWRR